jgi:ERF superfamily
MNPVINNQQSIYSKLHKIQSEVGSLFRTEENKFQRYKFFNEKQVLELLNPLLKKYKLGLFFSDAIITNGDPEKGNYLDTDSISNMHFNKEEKE